MKYTNKDINRILRIREFVETSNTLSKVYLDFDNKEYSIATFNDKDRIFKVYCSSIYNLIKAIKDDKQYFDKSHKYDEFDKLINEKFIAEKSDYLKIIMKKHYLKYWKLLGINLIILEKMKMIIIYCLMLI